MPGSLTKAHKIAMKGPAATGAVLQDRHRRASQESPIRAFVQAPVRHGARKTLMQGFLNEDPTKTFTRSSVEDLFRIMQSISKVLMQGLFWRNLNRISDRISNRSSQKDLRKSRRDTLRTLRQGLRTRACTGSCKTVCRYDLHKVFLQGPVQDHARQGPLR